MNGLPAIAQWLKTNDGFTIFAHVSPDGDTLGASLALLGALKRMGKRAQLVCANPVPAIYAFLPRASELLRPDAAADYENAIAVDCAAADRLGAALPLFKRAAHTANIDHHVTNPGYAEHNHVEDRAATGEIVYELIGLLGTLDADTASCLYTALMTDTGNFSYTNTTPTTYRIAAALVEAGADNAAINRHIYRTVPARKARLLGAALGSLQLLCDGRLGVAIITQTDLRKAGATSEDVEGIIDHVRDIDTVEVALLLRESSEPNTGKVSLRSKTQVDVSRISDSMGGGGHIRAAGYTDHGDFSAICARAISVAMAALMEASC